MRQWTMRWRMRIGHYKPETTIMLLNGRIDPPTLVTEQFRERYAFPGMTDEDLFCLVFFDFSRSIKVAFLDEGPLTPQEVHDRAAAVYARTQEGRTRRSRERGKRRRAMDDYVGLCEALLDEWRKGDLKAPPGFDLSEEFVPEPYLAFDDHPLDDPDRPRIVLLTTNPGGGMAFQCREAVGADAYRKIQDRLVARYTAPQTSFAEGDRISQAATNRINDMRRFREALGKDFNAAEGFLQCEIVPLHSANLPGKRKLVELLQTQSDETWLGRYIASLRNLLATSHVITIDATNRLDTGDELWEGRWLAYRSNLMGYEPKRARLLDRKEKDGKTTVRFEGYVERGLMRVYGLVQGGNRFAGDASKIARALLSGVG